MRLSELYKVALSFLLIKVCSPQVDAHEEENRTARITVQIFGNDSFSREYGFPIVLATERKVFVEVRDSQNALVVLPKAAHVAAYKDASHDESLGYTLIHNYCPVEITTDYLENEERGARFMFSIRQYFGVAEQYLFLHIIVTTCQRQERPRLTVFNCATQAEYCPHQGEDFVSAGPFIVVPSQNLPKRSHRSTPRPKFKTPSGNTEQSNTRDHKKCHSDLIIILISIGFFLFGMTVTSLMLLLNCKGKVNESEQAAAHDNTGGDMATILSV